ncbi:cysteinyl-tRNA synthetase [Butyrivibrio sp. ob235]|uniref:cysteine--tRNA ligase n=1 Tax=Butyrivibrio sp. ob235 TaxID=1761780 RepID=UPI0008D64918|nr:cysteine--tRNA ligase [Butyrivibrio sp. ob235]SEL36486.1 cysteinyl-tRNA synthetase [Butyrivibrio sp. ob235]
MPHTFSFYNTLSRKIDDFVPREEGKVSMYTCGPTVYHFAHIGNIRTYIMQDALIKALEYCGYDVKRVMNITDVGHLSSDADTGEDKMLAGAKREHKTVMEIADFYTKAFFKDFDAVGNKRPDVIEPATNCIPEFIHMVETLLEKGYAYVAGGNVYFDTSKLEDYYVFSSAIEKEELQVGVRDDVEEDTAKKNKTDFVLWFTKSKFEDQALKWDSPWGVGYPGWHIECSCISMKHLGEYIDIHCGGVDNIFPHHTNEIAQSESYLGHEWCKYWFHSNHLNDRAGKMSKSKGAVLTVSVLQEKGYDPLVYRFFCLQSHYRKPLEFSFDVLDNTVTAYNNLVKKVEALIASDDALKAADKNLESFLNTVRNSADVDKAVLKEFEDKFADAISNDLNTSMAVTLLYDVFKADTNAATKLAIIDSFDMVLSLDLIGHALADDSADIDPELEAYIKDAIERRAAAKKAKDFATADAIRDELLAKGVEIKDTREGVKWTLV